ncbi:DUF6252 family protein [Aequorivita marina]|uniref:DUF6252 family protein n=1 Tax=Aequorivita marina TaxID=3073654 RepID=UPI00287488BE|nr:DUF6252 family protein [Aequorivita sp. S2608]MDS1297204.1 DUF6252 family protein [Aequorivita sp. S2608]
MKIFNKTILVLMTVLAVSLTGCSKDDDGGEDPQGGTGTFKAKVDGDNFTGIEGTVMAVSSAEGSSFTVSGGTMESENLQIVITQGFDGVGTYDLGLMNIGTYSYLPDPNNPDPSTVVIYSTVGNQSAGELRVSSYDGSVAKGTFSFNAANLDNPNETVSVTSGEFNIEVTEQ